MPLALPPGEGHCPFLLNDLRSFSQGLRIFWGATPRPPVRAAPANRFVGSVLGLRLLGDDRPDPPYGLAPANRWGGFCWGFTACGGMIPTPVRAGACKPLGGFCWGFALLGGGGTLRSPGAGWRLQAAAWVLWRAYGL